MVSLQRRRRPHAPSARSAIGRYERPSGCSQNQLDGIYQSTYKDPARYLSLTLNVAGAIQTIHLLNSTSTLISCFIVSVVFALACGASHATIVIDRK